MFLLFLILLICPVLAADVDEEEFPGLRQILEQTRRDAESADAQKAIQASLKKHASPVRVRYDSDDEETQAALALSLITHQTTEFIDYIKACRAPQYDALFTQLDRGAWDAVLKKVGVSGKRAQTVVLLLSRVKNELSKDPDASRLLTSIDDALLRIFSGCWGFSKIKPDGAVMTQLKQAAKGIGYRFADELRAYDVAGKLDAQFKSEGKWEGATDLNVRKHFMALYGYVASGYLEQKFHAKVEAGGRGVYKNYLACGAQALFPKTDTVGLVLDDLVTDPEKAFRERKAVVKTGIKPVAFEGLADFIRREVTPEEIENLQQYLKTFDLGSPGITENEGLLKLLQKALQQISIPMEEALAGLQREGSLEPAVNIKELAVLLREAVMYTAISKDAVYDKGVEHANKRDRFPLTKKSIDQALSTWVLEYLYGINENSHEVLKGYKVIYPGWIHGKTPKGTKVSRQLGANDVLSINEQQLIEKQEAARQSLGALQEEFIRNHRGEIITTLRLASLDDATSLPTGYLIAFIPTPTGARLELQKAGVAVVGITTDTPSDATHHGLVGNIKKIVKDFEVDLSKIPAIIGSDLEDVQGKKLLQPFYEVVADDRFRIVPYIGKALDYLIKLKVIERELKLPLLLMIHNGWLD